MANNIVYDYAAMEAAVKAINDIAENYRKAGATFQSKFIEAINLWEGDSKNKVATLINGDVNTLLTVQVPSFVNALADLLNENIKQMKAADEQIAGSIPDKLNG